MSLPSALGTLTSIAVNEATKPNTWPMPFRLIQHDPWAWVTVSTLVAIGSAVLLPYLNRKSTAEGAHDAGPAIGVSVEVRDGVGVGVGQITVGSLGQLILGAHRDDAPASPPPAAKQQPKPEVAGLPEFVPGTLHDRRTLMTNLEAKMDRTNGVFVALVGAAGIGKTAIAAELLRKREKKVGAGYLAARGYPRVSAFSVLERLAEAVPAKGRRQPLVERLNEGETDLLTRLKDVLDRLGNRQVWLAVDDAQDLFVTSTGKWRDDALGTLFDELAKRRRHRIKVLFIGTDPLPFPHAVTERVTEGLPRPNFPGFLAELTIPGAPAPLVMAGLAKATNRHPRTAELVLGIRAIGSPAAADPLDAAPDASALISALLARLTDGQRAALRALAILDRPARPAVIAYLADATPGEVRAALDELVRCRLLRRYDDHYYLPDGESARITADVPDAEIAGQRVRAAEYLENAARGRDAARLDDLEDAFHAVDLYVTTGESGRAVRLMAQLDDRYLRSWGQTAELAPWLSRLNGGLAGFRDQVRYVMLAGRALAQQGKLPEAIETVDGGATMSAGPENLSAHLGFLVQSAGYRFRAGAVAAAAERYQALMDRAPAGHKAVPTAHLGLALCLAEAGDFTRASEHLDAAESGGTSADPGLDVPLRYLRALISFERGQDGVSLEQLERARDAAEKAGARVAAARCDDLSAWAWLLRHNLGEATKAARRAHNVSVRVGDPDLWSTSGTTVAVIELQHGHQEPALAAAELAARYADGIYAAEAIAVRGVAAIRNGDTGEETRRAFVTAAGLARDLRAVAPGTYRPYEVEGLALAGLALLRPEQGEGPAADAYRAAQGILDLRGARFRRRVLFAALTAGWPGDPLPGISSLLA
ncbi:AAA family ATPase [Actinoplanes subtropicus]|uniref:AAA family ATPase n=1 Tax=Actinoplanes subtropicus TaxID=543632 RepID=UPI000AF8ED6B|nr:ATP-binding protein [Actinoplanes subtropicus]